MYKFTAAPVSILAGFCKYTKHFSDIFWWKIFLNAIDHSLDGFSIRFLVLPFKFFGYSFIAGLAHPSRTQCLEFLTRDVLSAFGALYRKQHPEYLHLRIAPVFVG
jgi:hypothetical protein